ncbi:2164_t:CDS:2 [Cetraspora pellucida]|uniref:2164_t:CDS:1 n=1 Tax=Cetraspora pellucida TaxID=1433469 RepID=A0ACA9L8A9_9GLOM|nr:2164_t:CDS:2 [Cetraspora pellucida]
MLMTLNKEANMTSISDDAEVMQMSLELNLQHLLVEALKFVYHEIGLSESGQKQEIVASGQMIRYNDQEQREMHQEFQADRPCQVRMLHQAMHKKEIMKWNWSYWP